MAKAREPRWEQIGGDISAHAYGAVLGKYDARNGWLDWGKITPMTEHLHPEEVIDFAEKGGGAYMVESGSFLFTELDDQESVRTAAGELGIKDPSRLSAKNRRLMVAQYAIDYGEGVGQEEYEDTFRDAVGHFAEFDEVKWSHRPSVEPDFNPLQEARETVRWRDPGTVRPRIARRTRRSRGPGPGWWRQSKRHAAAARKGWRRRG